MIIEAKFIYCFILGNDIPLKGYVKAKKFIGTYATKLQSVAGLFDDYWHRKMPDKLKTIYVWVLCGERFYLQDLYDDSWADACVLVRRFTVMREIGTVGQLRDAYRNAR